MNVDKLLVIGPWVALLPHCIGLYGPHSCISLIVLLLPIVLGLDNGIGLIWTPHGADDARSGMPPSGSKPTSPQHERRDQVVGLYGLVTSICRSLRDAESEY